MRHFDKLRLAGKGFYKPFFDTAESKILNITTPDRVLLRLGFAKGWEKVPKLRLEQSGSKKVYTEDRALFK